MFLAHHLAFIASIVVLQVYEFRDTSTKRRDAIIENFIIITRRGFNGKISLRLMSRFDITTLAKVTRNTTHNYNRFRCNVMS